MLPKVSDKRIQNLSLNCQSFLWFLFSLSQSLKEYLLPDDLLNNYFLCKSSKQIVYKIEKNGLKWTFAELIKYSDLTSSFMMRFSASPNDSVRFLILSAFLSPFFFFFFFGFSSSSSSKGFIYCKKSETMPNPKFKMEKLY